MRGFSHQSGPISDGFQDIPGLAEHHLRSSPARVAASLAASTGLTGWSGAGQRFLPGLGVLELGWNELSGHSAEASPEDPVVRTRTLGDKGVLQPCRSQSGGGWAPNPNPKQTQGFVSGGS